MHAVHTHSTVQYTQYLQAEAAHKALLATKAKLEYDIHVKTISLEIDTSKCMHGRQVG